MKVKTIIRIFLKSFLWWLTILAIFFYNLKEVNLIEQPRWHIVVFSNKKIKKIKKYYNFSQDIKLIKKSINEEIKIKKLLEKKKYEKEKKEYLSYIVDKAINKKHFSAWKKKKITYKKLCNYFKNYCSIIDIDSTEFTEKEKIYYVGITIYLLKFLDKVFPWKINNIYYIKLQKEKIWRRWYAWHHSLVLNIKKWMSYKEFFEVLTHEMWHIVDLWFITGKSWFKSSQFTEFGKKSFSEDDKSLIFYSYSWQSEKIKKANVYTKDFVSWYALTDPFEDFAETFNMYINHNYVFRQMMKESNILKYKYQYMDNLLKWHFLLSDKSFKYRTYFRPRDSTKMKNQLY